MVKACALFAGERPQYLATSGRNPSLPTWRTSFLHFFHVDPEPNDDEFLFANALSISRLHHAIDNAMKEVAFKLFVWFATWFDDFKQLNAFLANASYLDVLRKSCQDSGHGEFAKAFSSQLPAFNDLRWGDRIQCARRLMYKESALRFAFSAENLSIDTATSANLSKIISGEPSGQKTKPLL